MKGRIIRSPDGLVSGTLLDDPQPRAEAPLLVFIHGGGCNGCYFDLKGSSSVEAARARGFPTLVIDRPGYGGNPAPEGATPIQDSVPVIRGFIDLTLSDHAPGSSGVVIIGHSIGGAIALTLASERGEWALRAVAVSGIGDEPPGAWTNLELAADQPKFEPARDFTDALFFDPEGSIAWRRSLALRAATEPWLLSEVVEVVTLWPERWPGLAGRIDVPVHLRLAEYDRIWMTGQEVVDRMAAKLTASPRVDSALLREGGHLFEIYRNGPQLIESQLDFIESVLAGQAI